MPYFSFLPSFESRVFSFMCIMSLWLKLTNRKIDNGSAVSWVFHRRMLCVQTEKVSLVASPSHKEIFKVSQHVETSRLRTRLCFWWCFHLVGFQAAIGTLCSALLTDQLSPGMHFTSEHKKWRNRFLRFLPKGAPVRACDTKIRLLSQLKWKQVDAQFIDGANAFTHAVPAMQTFSSRCA